MEEITNDLRRRMAFAEIDVEQKYHKHIIGKSGANVGRIKDETGVSIRIPPDNENSNIIRIEGSPEGVGKAKDELMQMVHKMVSSNLDICMYTIHLPHIVGCVISLSLSCCKALGLVLKSCRVITNGCFHLHRSLKLLYLDQFISSSTLLYLKQSYG